MFCILRLISLSTTGGVDVWISLLFAYDWMICKTIIIEHFSKRIIVDFGDDGDEVNIIV